MEKLSTNLKNLRKSFGLTQKQLADKLNVNRSVYNRYECGKRKIPIMILWKLADFFKTSIDKLVRG